MIHNNVYNIPQKALKQSKIIIETTPLFPHQVNRIIDNHQHKMQHYLHKRAIPPYFIENSVTEASRIAVSPQPIIKQQSLQSSSVTHWDSMNSPPQSHLIRELNEKLTAVTSRLDAHERKLTILMEVNKHQQSTTLSDSSSHSQDMLPLHASKQLERYHSSEQTLDKIREEFSSYQSQSQKISQSLKAQMHQQRDSITHQLISSFRESLKEKFAQEQTKISECLSDFIQLSSQKLDNKISEVKLQMKQSWQSLTQSFYQKEQQNQNQILKQKLLQLAFSFDQFQSNYSSFQEEIKQTFNCSGQFNRGVLKVSKQQCSSEVLHLRYEEYLSIAQNSLGLSVKSTERTYVIDDQGYLLDSNKFYLLDSKNNRIRLSEIEIQKLKEAGLCK